MNSFNGIRQGYSREAAEIDPESDPGQALANDPNDPENDPGHSPSPID